MAPEKHPPISETSAPKTAPAAGQALEREMPERLFTRLTDETRDVMIEMSRGYKLLREVEGAVLRIPQFHFNVPGSEPSARQVFALLLSAYGDLNRPDAILPIIDRLEERKKSGTATPLSEEELNILIEDTRMKHFYWVLDHNGPSAALSIVRSDHKLAHLSTVISIIYKFITEKQYPDAVRALRELQDISGEPYAHFSTEVELARAMRSDGLPVKTMVSTLVGQAFEMEKKDIEGDAEDISYFTEAIEELCEEGAYEEALSWADRIHNKEAQQRVLSLIAGCAARHDNLGVYEQTAEKIGDGIGTADKLHYAHALARAGRGRSAMDIVANAGPASGELTLRAGVEEYLTLYHILPQGSPDKEAAHWRADELLRSYPAGDESFFDALVVFAEQCKPSDRQDALNRALRTANELTMWKRKVGAEKMLSLYEVSSSLGLSAITYLEAAKKILGNTQDIRPENGFSMAMDAIRSIAPQHKVASRILLNDAVKKHLYRFDIEDPKQVRWIIIQHYIKAIIAALREEESGHPGSLARELIQRAFVLAARTDVVQEGGAFETIKDVVVYLYRLSVQVHEDTAPLLEFIEKQDLSVAQRVFIYASIAAIDEQAGRTNEEYAARARDLRAALGDTPKEFAAHIDYVMSMLNISQAKRIIATARQRAAKLPEDQRKTAGAFLAKAQGFAD